eukprot:95554-Prymnesium_polylepis.2
MLTQSGFLPRHLKHTPCLHTGVSMAEEACAAARSPPVMKSTSYGFVSSVSFTPRGVVSLTSTLQRGGYQGGIHTHTMRQGKGQRHAPDPKQPSHALSEASSVVLLIARRFQRRCARHTLCRQRDIAARHERLPHRALTTQVHGLFQLLMLVPADVEAHVPSVARRVVVLLGVRTAQHEARGSARRSPAVRVEDHLQPASQPDPDGPEVVVSSGLSNDVTRDVDQ